MIHHTQILKQIAKINELQIQLLRQYHTCSGYLRVFFREQSLFTKRITPCLTAYSVLAHEYLDVLKECNEYSRNCAITSPMTDELHMAGQALEQQLNQMIIQCLHHIQKNEEVIKEAETLMKFTKQYSDN